MKTLVFRVGNTLRILGIIAAAGAVLNVFAGWTELSFSDGVKEIVRIYRTIFHELIMDKILIFVNRFADIQINAQQKDFFVLYFCGFGAALRANNSLDRLFEKENITDVYFYIGILLLFLWPLYLLLILHMTFGSLLYFINDRNSSSTKYIDAYRIGERKLREFYVEIFYIAVAVVIAVILGGSGLFAIEFS